MKTDPYCQRQNCSPLNVLFSYVLIALIWLWWGDMRRMRWTRRRVNRMRLTEWRKELISQVRWCKLCERWFVLRKLRVVELGWQ